MRTALKTVRLRQEEARWVESFLKQNRAFAGFSEMARLAILDFMQRRSALPIQPVTLPRGKKSRPGFLWDYDIDSTEVKAILAESPFSKRAWLIGRILEHAPFEEVWEYLSVEEVREALPKLRMDPKRKKQWEIALEEWSG